MKRSQVILSIVAALLVVVLFYVLAFQPQRDRVAEIEDEIAAEQTQQTQLTNEINRLRSVREQAPEVEAELAAAEAVVPRDAALPSALRQLQLAADESGTVLQTVSTSRPAAVEGGPDGLASIDVSLQLVGGYFQVVDFLRRVEDPSITPRGLTWSSATVSRNDYPELTVSLSGDLYTTIDQPAADAEEPVADESANQEADDPGDVGAEVEDAP